MSDAVTMSAAGRAAAALARTDQVSVPLEPETHTGIRGPELDVLTGELESLLAELEAAGEDGATVAAVAARLGRCRALRFVLDGDPADRERALALLDQARTSPLLGPQEQEAAYRGLVALTAFRLVRLNRDTSVLSEPHWNVDRLMRLMELGTPLAHGGPGIVEDTALLWRLLLEREHHRMTPELRARAEGLLAMTDAMTAGDTGAFVREARSVLAGLTGGEIPGSLGTLLTLLLGELEQSLARSPGPAEPATGGAGTAVATRGAITEFLALAEAMSPGLVGPGNMPGLLAELTGEHPGTGREDGRTPLPSRMVGAFLHAARAMYSGDVTGFREALRLVHEAWAEGELDSDPNGSWLTNIVPVMLFGAAMNGGSLEDEDLALELFETQRWEGDPASTAAANLRVCGEAMRLTARLTSALDRGDVGTVWDVIDALCELEVDEVYAAAEEWTGLHIGMALGIAYLGIVVLDSSGADRTAHLRAAVHHMRRAVETAVDMPVLRSLLDMTWAPLLTLTAIAESDPSRIAEGVRRARAALAGTEFVGGLRPRTRGAIAAALDTLHIFTGDAGALDEAIGELTQGVADLPDGMPGGAGLTWDLAALYAKRARLRAGGPGADEDLTAALGFARTSLRYSADDVLLQQGVGRGLRIARAAADRGRAAAFWALRAGRTEDAISCLEAGRSLVLGAAAVSAGVADRLAALGESELAERWRAAADPAQDRGADRSLWELSADVASGTPGGRSGGSPMEVLAGLGAGSPGLPGDVRRRSLELLRGRGGAELEPVLPSVDDLRAGLRATDADALLYLVPGVDDPDGAVLIVPREGPAEALPLPALTPAGRRPVAEYLAAGADRQRLETTAEEEVGGVVGAVGKEERERAERRWLRALDGMCAWAGEVLGPALAHLGAADRADAGADVFAAPAGAGADSGAGTAAGGGTRPGAVRLVLVPCGELGVVPWQAALLGPPAGSGSPVGHGEPAGSGVSGCEVPGSGVPGTGEPVGHGEPAGSGVPGPEAVGSGVPVGTGEPAGSRVSGPEGPGPEGVGSGVPGPEVVGPEVVGSGKPGSGVPVGTGERAGSGVSGPEGPGPGVVGSGAPGPGEPAGSGKPGPGKPGPEVPAAGRPRPVRACEVGVLTHAASGREFLRAAARRRMPLTGRPALVFHGGDDLEWAEEEIDTLAAVLYRDAVVHRPHEDPATPETVLALLGGRAAAPASLVHLACHGLAGTDPTRSALLLADPDEADEPARTARLTLSTLLETPAEGDAFRSAGPLVVCGGCETDLTTRDHDEALTVTSVLVHRLAADAIGSRWKVDDKRSELMMLVLHDALSRGLAPPDALRAAQRWMLTPPDERPPVPALSRISAGRLAEDFRDRPDTWAAFVHHGNPAPAAPAARQREGEPV
ncbi:MULTISPECIES: CHAT domain-containing protein [Streptomyces]|uniref:CHAT domain-containing protein n=1 Tax=Streptomyces TaxID=1883 RepID=UPI001676F5AC|nr:MULTISPECIES: CHAT domain-containing protein [Streptomyces]MBK3524355.1 CHAT domain-containing protein [Streptomyces sp. MBT70]